MTHIIRQVVQGSKIVGADKGLGIEIAGGLAVPPKNRNGMNRQRIVHLFRRPAEPLLVLKCDGETVRFQKFKFCRVTRGGQETGVIETTAGGVHPPPPVQGVEKLHPLGYRPIDITGE